MYYARPRIRPISSLSLLIALLMPLGSYWSSSMVGGRVEYLCSSRLPESTLNDDDESTKHQQSRYAEIEGDVDQHP